MQNFITEPISKNKRIFRYVVILLTFIFCAFIIPKPGKFMYDFEVGKTWQNQDLVAPLSFAIEKTTEEIERDRQEIKDNFSPYYVHHTEIHEKQIAAFENIVNKAYENGQITNEEKYNALDIAAAVFKEVYDEGIIQVDDKHKDKGSNFIINYQHNRLAQKKPLINFNSYSAALNIANEAIANEPVFRKANLNQELLSLVEADILYNHQLSQSKLEEKLDEISLNKGMVNAGEVVIHQGNVITEERYQVLESLRKEYERNITSGERHYYVMFGYLLLLAITFLVFTLYIEQFQREIIRKNRSIVLIMVNILLFVFLSSYVTETGSFSIYLIPFCIVPIVILAFFGSRVAFITHLVLIMMVSLFVQNRFEFMIVQLLAGFTAIISMMQVRYLSHFFIASLLIFATYILSYFAINLIQTASLYDINWFDFLWFFGNFLLILLAYPLIYAFEKLFGFVSDITLIELGDVNNKMLRKLALEAPGTFQHSLQVANISESVLNKLNGNALLARVASLYHDIGKMHNPGYFIENQRYIKNPHDDISNEESAKVIIEHVTKGVEMAKSHGLPELIIDFIRTHHGDSRIEYFYQDELKKLGTEINEEKYRYPGPKPGTKEAAVVMIVDSIEAASRSLKHPDEETIEKLVDNIIDHKIKDNQFEDADITMKEIKACRAIIKDLFKSLYHVRVAYPESEVTKKSN